MTFAVICLHDSRVIDASVLPRGPGGISFSEMQQWTQL